MNNTNPFLAEAQLFKQKMEQAQAALWDLLTQDEDLWPRVATQFIDSDYSKSMIMSSLNPENSAKVLSLLELIRR